MGFNYNKGKKGHEDGFQWGSYADLFMLLALVFLMLYSVTSLRSGTSAIQQNLEYQRLSQEAEDLKQQIKVYNTLKQDYLEKGSSQDEQQVYTELMDKLTLLQDEAKNEKEGLRKQALENEKKEQALNKYQQLIRNIVNANLVAQARIKKRDTIIEEKDDIIDEKAEEIQSLEKTVAEKKAIIAKGEQKIASINYELNHKIKELNQAYENNEITKKNLDAQTAKLREDSTRRIEALKDQNKNMSAQLAEVNSNLENVNTELSRAKSTIEKQEGEKNRLTAELEGAAAKYGSQMDELRKNFQAERDRDRAAFEKQLAGEKLSAAARAEREAQYRAAAAQKERELGEKLAALDSKVKDTEGQLVKARAQANARKMLAQEIMKNFHKNGIEAEVDPGTGDVVLNFGNQYFDTGKANLKPEMRDILEKALPAYAESLFGNEKIASKIKEVEFVGFASPTYKGKYIDPASLDQGDRTAVDYNLDLSFGRARSIFQYVFDTNKMTFKHQKRLLPLVKVTGRSFLAETKKGNEMKPGATGKEFCEQHDCVKAQRVIIKFNLNE